MTVEHARVALRHPGSPLLLFWNVVCGLRHRRGTVDPSVQLQYCIARRGDRVSEGLLRNAFALLNIMRQCRSPRAGEANAGGMGGQRE